MKIFRLRKHHTLAALLLAFGCSLLWLPSAQSQDRQDKAKVQKTHDSDTLRIDTELVQIDVVVTDKQGKLVNDLKREDFQLMEDGKPQQLSHFSVGTAGRQATWLRTAPKTCRHPIRPSRRARR